MAGLRLDDQWLHAWLEHWIYADRSLWQLCRDAFYAALLVLALALPLAIRKDIAEGRKRRLGRALKGANLITPSPIPSVDEASRRHRLAYKRPSYDVGTAFFKR